MRKPQPQPRSAQARQRQPQRHPEQWSTGEEPMTNAQWAYLHTLSEAAGAPLDEPLTKAQAAQRIEALQRQTGRGLSRQTPRRRVVCRTAVGKRRAE